eukprot:m.826905 g.826905  ORF g.826905 m.826905 type:complete len:148 (-) comp59424_c0_seq2:61-504(-)
MHGHELLPHSLDLRILFLHHFSPNSGTFVGHYPWFFTYNTLNEKLPRGTTTLEKLMRSAGIGFCASVVSDTTANSIRVIKVAKQASKTNISYVTAVREIVAADGVKGLLFRGLGTRLLTNGLQGMMFTVIWRALSDEWAKRQAANTA